MRYRTVGVDVEFRPKDFLSFLALKVLRPVDREIARLRFKLDPTLVGIRWSRDYFEKEKHD